MTGVGLSQLFAAPPTVSLSPASQTVKLAQTATTTVSVNTDTETVRGGSVEVNFNANLLSFVELTPLSPDDFTISNQTATASRLTFDFNSTSGNKSGSFDLAAIKFKTQNAGSTTKTEITGTGTSYNQTLVLKNDFPDSDLSASITIKVDQASSSSSPSTQPDSSPGSTNDSGTTDQPSAPAEDQEADEEQTPADAAEEEESTGLENGEKDEPAANAGQLAANQQEDIKYSNSKLQSLILAGLGGVFIIASILFYVYHPRIATKKGPVPVVKKIRKSFFRHASKAALPTIISPKKKTPTSDNGANQAPDSQKSPASNVSNNAPSNISKEFAAELASLDIQPTNTVTDLPKPPPVDPKDPSLYSKTVAELEKLVGKSHPESADTSGAVNKGQPAGQNASPPAKSKDR